MSTFPALNASVSSSGGGGGGNAQSSMIQGTLSVAAMNSSLAEESPAKVTAAPAASVLHSAHFSNSVSEITSDCVLPREFKNRLNKLFHQIEREYELEYRKLYVENLALQERLEKYEEGGEHDVKLNAKKRYQISQRIKQQYKERTSRVLSRFHQSSFGVGSSGSTGGAFGLSSASSHHFTLQYATRFSGHRDGVWEVTAGRRNTAKLLASASADGTVRLWNAETGNILLIYLGHQNSSVNSVRLHQDLLLSAAGDGSANLLRLSHYENLLALEGSDLASHSSHKRSSFQAQASGTKDNNDSEDASNSTAQNDNASPRGHHDGSSTTLTSREQPSLRLSEVVSGDLDSSMDSGSSIPAPLSMTAGLGQDVTLAARNCFMEANVAVVRHPLVVYQESSNENNYPTNGSAFPLSAADFLPCMSHIVTGSWDRIGRVYDINSGHLLTHLTGHDQGITDVRCFQQKILTAAKDGTFRLWDYRKGGHQDVLVLQCHNQAVSSAQFVDDTGDRLFTAGSSDRTCKLWDLRHTRSSLYTIRVDAPINKFAINPDLGLVALPMDNSQIKLVEISTGNRVGRLLRANLQTHQRIIASVAWAESPRAAHNLFSSSFDNQIFAWHVAAL